MVISAWRYPGSGTGGFFSATNLTIRVSGPICNVGFNNTVLNTFMSNKDNTESPIIRVLVISKGKDQIYSIKKALGETVYTVKIAGAAPEKDAEMALQRYVWDLVFVTLDATPPGVMMNYVALARQKSSTPVLAISSDANSQDVVQAMSVGVRDVVDLSHQSRLLYVVKRELGDLSERRNHIIAREQRRHQQKGVTEIRQMEDSMAESVLIETGSGAMPFKLIPGSKYDMTTNLYSYQYFMTEVGNVLADINEYNEKYAVLYFEFADMNAFRSELGINASEIMLAEIATIMHDNIGQLGPIARFSNQVFVVLVAFSSIDAVLEVINATRSQVSEHMRITLPKRLPQVSISVGMCMLNRASETAYQLLTKAAQACDIARNINQSGVHIYNPEVDAVGNRKAVVQLRDWEREIYQALTDGRFKVIFQMISKIDVGDGDDYELLFRMSDKETGADIMPAEFIVAAEQSGLIVVIDQWVTSQAINMIADDIAKGRKGKYFIKLSNRTLASDDFINWLMAEMKKQRIQNNRLVFEINTTELVKRPIEVHALVRALHRINCRVVLEYFGTQKNHMSIIEHFFFDYIKLDRSLTHGIVDDMSRLGMVRSIVAQAKIAGIGTIAEFIEDAKTLSALCNVGVDFIQGHFVQHPGGAMDVSNS